MDQGLYTGAIFLDLRKAFDVVNQGLLVTKLQMYGRSSSTLGILLFSLWSFPCAAVDYTSTGVSIQIL